MEPTVLYSALHAKLTQVSVAKKPLSPVRCKTGSRGMNYLPIMCVCEREKEKKSEKKDDAFTRATKLVQPNWLPNFE